MEEAFMKKAVSWKGKETVVLMCMVFLIQFWAFPSSSEGGVPESEHAGAARFALSGRLLDVQKAPVKGAEVIVMHRSSNVKFQTKSDSRGRYALSIDPGPYDLGVFVQGHAQYAGPIVVEGKTIYDMTVDRMDGLPAGRVYGKIKDKGGAPLSGVTVTLHANEGAPKVFPHRKSVETDSKGFFQLDDVPESYFDLVFSGEGVDISEMVDIIKDYESCRVDLLVNTRHRNVWQPGMEAFVSQRMKSGSKDCTVTLSTPVKPDGIWYLVLGCGEGKYTVHEGQNEIDCGVQCPVSCWEIRVAKDGVWNRPYAIHFWVNGYISPWGNIAYTFTDTDNREYESNWINSQGEHILYSDSKNLSIQKIYYEFD